jgi:hypothetical protein
VGLNDAQIGRRPPKFIATLQLRSPGFVVVPQILMQRRRARFLSLEHRILAKFAPEFSAKGSYVSPRFFSILPLVWRWERSRPRRKAFTILLILSRSHLIFQRSNDGCKDRARDASTCDLTYECANIHIAPGTGEHRNQCG